MTDFKEFRERLEMSELLEQEYENQLMVKIPNSKDDAIIDVVFVFDDEEQLIGMYAE